jgi:hypothetical protein
MLLSRLRRVDLVLILVLDRRAGVRWLDALYAAEAFAALAFGLEAAPGVVSEADLRRRRWHRQT